MTGLITAIDAHRCSNGSRHPCVQQVAHSALGLEEAVVFCYQYWSTNSTGTMDHLHRFLQTAAEWLFDHHSKTGIERLQRVRAVEKRRAGDEHCVGLYLG
jgi:hypothetical protein